MVDNPTYPERTDRLLDLPEARITSSRKDSLIPGVKNEHLMIAGVAVSGLLSLLALSQSQGVQNLIKRFTTRGQPVQAQQAELPDNFGEPIQPQSRVNQPTQQQLAVINDAQQRAQAEQIAANLAAQEQLQQQQVHQAQSNASMYDSIGPNTIRVDSQRGRQQYRYGSPFGANISTN